MMAVASITLNIFWTVLLVLILGGFGLLIAGWLQRVLRVRADKKHSLKLVNKGNCPSLYYLSTRSLRSELAFTYLFNNIPLAPVFEEMEVAQESLSQDTHPDPALRSVNSQKKAKPAGALKAGKSVAAKSGNVASLLGTLGGLLPGELGAGLKDKASKARDVQIRTAKVTQSPQLVTNKMDAAKNSGGKLGVKSSTQESQNQVKETASLAAASSPDSQIVQPVLNQHDYKVNSPVLQDTGLVQTTELRPGEALLLTLLIGTTRTRYPVGSFNYSIRSQQIPVDGRFGNPAPVSKTATVYFKPIPNWRYWIPKISSSLVLLLALLGIFYGLTYLWG